MFKLPETKQEVFNIVYTHLFKQNKQSFDGYICCYRNENLKCAAGVLIPDECYKPEFEGRGWRRLVEENVVPPEHSDLICDLQFIHDTLETEDWPKFLTDLAKRYGLEIPTL
jgi:hypothetical protein